LKSTLYIDIDGVLNSLDEAPPAWRADAPAFLRWALQHFICVFLTRWHERAVIIAKCLTPLGLKDKADQFDYPRWRTLKTDGIDFSQPFYWLDDNPEIEDEDVLRERGASHRLIRVDPYGELELRNIAKILAQRESAEQGHRIPDLEGQYPSADIPGEPLSEPA
jgi:hypothetical protein